MYALMITLSALTMTLSAALSTTGCPYNDSVWPSQCLSMTLKMTLCALTMTLSDFTYDCLYPFHCFHNDPVWPSQLIYNPSKWPWQWLAVTYLSACHNNNVLSHKCVCHPSKWLCDFHNDALWSSWLVYPNNDCMWPSLWWLCILTINVSPSQFFVPSYLLFVPLPPSLCPSQ